MIKINDSLNINYIKDCEKNYKQFLGISNFPEYKIACKEITLDKAKMQGFDSFASASYDCSTGIHTLEIWSKIYNSKTLGRYIVFHELTHIFDDEKYAQKDNLKYVSNHGYTEYHASQIELLQLLGAKNIYQHISFSLNSTIETIAGKETIKQFVEKPCFHAIDLINRSDFPANVETLKTTLGIIFNYYGRRSICQMYATDYYDENNDIAIGKLLYPETVTFLKKFMTGWFNDKKVNVINQFYLQISFGLIKKYNLL